MFTYTPGLFGIPVPRLDDDYYDSNLLARCYFIVGRSLSGGTLADTDTRVVGHGAGGTWSDFRVST
jgi:hypothetical protein